MKLYGQEVPQSVIDAANAAMVGRFTNDTIAYAIKGVWEGYDAYALADRLLQRARKAGKICYEGGYWHEGIRKAFDVRASIVSWLRAEHDMRMRFHHSAVYQADRDYNLFRAAAFGGAADAIERGEHLRNQVV